MNAQERMIVWLLTLGSALLLVLIAAISHAKIVISDPQIEGSTAVMWLTFCDDAVAISDPANCPKGGAKLAAGDISGLQWRVDDRSSRCELLDDADGIVPDAIPYAAVIPAASMKQVGRCSNDKSVCCVVDADCGAGTCEVSRRGDPQLHIMTIQWDDQRGPQVEEVWFYVDPALFYP